MSRQIVNRVQPQVVVIARFPSAGDFDIAILHSVTRMPFRVVRIDRTINRYVTLDYFATEEAARAAANDAWYMDRGVTPKHRQMITA